MQTKPDVLQIEDDIRHVLDHIGQRSKFMRRPVNPERRNRRPLHRGEQYPAQRIAQRLSETALERRRGKFRITRRRSAFIHYHRLRHRK
ncbi:hypothetical protein SDC9_178050 [bioreactor metagenome]|uniref:Uncharacterized protein n=1 Tax=bioreactor metagenome TaxID=1076179 RepID=A0A645GXV1_9ZZZZ